MSVQDKIKNIEDNLKKKTDSKEYQSKYYKEHKQKLISQLCEKVECNICGRKVTKNRLNIHKTTLLCRKTLETRLKDEKTINHIKNLINFEPIV